MHHKLAILELFIYLFKKLKYKVMRMLVIMLLLPFLSVGQKCDIEKKVDKFDGTITYTTNYAKWAKFYKIIKGTDTIYFASFWCDQGTTGNYGKTGAIILFSDKTTLDKPSAKIECKYREGGGFDYNSFFEVTKEELYMMSTKVITDFKLYICAKSISESKGIKVKESIVCLIKS